MKTSLTPILLLFAVLCCGLAEAQVPQLINYQGRVVVGTTNFNGNGQFKFALVSANGSTTYWSNDGTSIAGSQPTNGVTLTVTQGLYSLKLGDTTLANMTAIPYSVFGNSTVLLRIWFNDGTDGWQQLAPDQQIAAVGYAMVAANVPNGAITSAQIANGAVGPNQIAAGAVGSAQLSTNITTLAAQNLNVSGNLSLPATSSAATGVLNLNGSSFLQAYGTGNTFVGSGAGNFTMTGGTNTGVGQSTLFSNTTGSQNTATGQTALVKNMSGTANSAYGVSALFFNTTGSYNVANGAYALYSNTSGTNNDAFGFTALENNSVGALNSAHGSSALFKNVIGSYNVADGANALYYNNSSGNVAIGYNALYSNISGTNNIAVGFNAGGGITNIGSNNIDIGSPGSSGDSAIIRVGTQGYQSNTYIAGIYGSSIGGTNNAPVYVNTLGQLGTVTASTFGYIPTGGMLVYPTTNAPSGYLICNGASEPTTNYPSLFGILGYRYGGSNFVFNLPNLTNAPVGNYIIKY